MKSLQQRLSVALVISLIIIFPTLWWLTDSTMQDIAEKYVMSHLAHEAESVLAATQVDKDEKLTLNTKQINPVYLQPFSGQYYQLRSNDDVIRSRSLWDKELILPNLTEGEKRRLYLSGPQQQSLLVMAYGYNKHDRTIVVAVAEDLSPTLAFIKPFQSRFMLIALAMLLLLIAMQIIILNHVFQPLKRIKQQINALDQGEIDRIDTDMPKEVSPLVEVTNQLLDELEQQLELHPRDNTEALKQVTKLPLAELRQLPDKETVQSEPAVDHPLQAQNVNAEHILEPTFQTPLDLSAIECDIEQEILTLISVLESMYQEKNLDITFIMPQTDVLLMDCENLLELSGNLLKNACKWAQSKVRLSVEIDDSIHLKIEDDGPGISETGMIDLAQQNIVLDQATSGYLLGLTTARLIAQQHSGQLKLSQSNDLGGYCVDVILPLASAL
ncbi:ATP-binding protein [Methylobacter sp. YRD-M1]|uniref:ATP-binding protein n=1 Tax=Methylobacter sp. YRD-M1 TaxID=2911520 RepID=UPI00227C2B0C|nr:sensor histidine kinase [Methylobacter sp. YRD-M1]WAK03891.1 sensor histidine kinase [Methylobacter sp. YRD-M1]